MADPLPGSPYDSWEVLGEDHGYVKAIQLALLTRPCGRSVLIASLGEGPYRRMVSAVSGAGAVVRAHLRRIYDDNGQPVVLLGLEPCEGDEPSGRVVEVGRTRPLFPSAAALWGILVVQDTADLLLLSFHRTQSSRRGAGIGVEGVAEAALLHAFCVLTDEDRSIGRLHSRRLLVDSFGDGVPRTA